MGLGLLFAATLGGAGADRPAAAGAAACPAAWAIVPGAPLGLGGPGDSGLRGVATAAGANDVWAVGYREVGAARQAEPLVEHWDGQRWREMPGPAGGAVPGSLRAVAAAGPDDIWAVGSSGPDGGAAPATGEQALIEHWDGQAWGLVPGPGLPGASRLNSVAVGGADDVWAVGETPNGAGSAALVLHWDGGRWAQIPAPGAAGGQAALYSVAVVGPDDVWAVGRDLSTDGSGGPIAHWDGRAWSSGAGATADGAPGQDTLYAVTAAGPQDVWAAGVTRPPAGDPQDAPPAPLLEHWDGATWRRVPGPNPGGSGGALYGLAAGSPADIWAVGESIAAPRGDGAPPARATRALHWDGTTWRPVASPDTDPQDDRFAAVAPGGPGAFWAVSDRHHGANRFAGGPLIARYAAACDTPAADVQGDCAPTGRPDPGAALGASGGMLHGLAAPGPRDLWAVGGYEAGGGPAIEHWDGAGWSLVPGPAAGRGGTQSSLRTVAAAGPHDLWAAGPGMLLHSDGATWASVPLVPDPRTALGAGEYDLYSLAALDRDNVWAVGAIGSDAPGAPQIGTLTIHWDGRQWSRVPGPPIPGAQVALLRGLAAVGADDLWAVGSYTTDPFAAPARALIEHWDGRAWSLVAGSYAGDTSTLYAVTAGGPRDVWAVGSAGMLSEGRVSQQQTLVEHWDGRTWSRISSPNPGEGGGALYAVAWAGPQDLWAAGSYLPDLGGPAHALALHRSGAAWTPVATADGGADASELVAVAVAGPGTVWAAGTALQPGHTQGLVVAFTPPCPPAPPSPAPTPIPVASPAPAANHPTARVADPHDAAVPYFPATGHTLRGRFLAYWLAHGGLTQFGYPLTEEFAEADPAGGPPRPVQYFERNRLELHPELPEPFAVSLGLLGRLVTAGREDEAPFRPLPPERPGGPPPLPGGHAIAPEFLAYWQEHGGVPLYGYPISEAFPEINATDGHAYLVQYFERQRLEYHPALPAPFRVSLGLLGVQVLEARGWLP